MFAQRPMASDVILRLKIETYSNRVAPRSDNFSGNSITPFELMTLIVGNRLLSTPETKARRTETRRTGIGQNFHVSGSKLLASIVAAEKP